MRRDPDLRRLLWAALFFAACAAVVALAALSGIYH